MAHADDSGSCTGEAVLKRKAISEIRLQDPKLWNKILWIRESFVKDDNSGVRKVDFYDFVTEHLGRTGYRDVWHLLKMAYPHVNRVRRGRKYMYWGIRHSDTSKYASSLADERQENSRCQQIPLSGDSCENAMRSDIETEEENTVNKALESTNESNNNGQQSIIEAGRNHPKGETRSSPTAETRGVENSRPRKQSTKGDRNDRCGSPSIPRVVVKTERVSDDDDAAQTPKPEEVVVMEFKEKDVFESFEDYEKSKSFEEDENKGKHFRVSRSRRSVSRSVSPPLEIFSEKQMPPELPPNKQFAYLNSSKSEEQKHLHGDDSKSAGEEKGYSKIEEHLADENGSAGKDVSVPNLLEPENINRVCIPLIHDVRKRSVRKSARISKGSDAEKREISDVESVTTGPSASAGNANSSLTTSNVVVPISSDKSRSSFDPVIVSVASMVGVKNPTNQKEACATLTTHPPSSNGSASSWGEPSRGNNGPLLSSQSEESSIEGDTQVVVVQDRGIQVCERSQDTAQRTKRTIQQSASTDSDRHLGVQALPTHSVPPNTRVTVRHQNHNESVKQSPQNELEMNPRKKLKPKGAAITQGIYTNPSMRALQPAVSKGAAEGLKVRSPKVNIVRVPGVPAGKAELPLANASRRAPMSKNYHAVLASQGTTVIGDSRATIPQQRVILFTSPPTSTNLIGSNSNKIPVVPSTLNTSFLSSGQPPLDSIATSKTVYYPISTLNQTMRDKRTDFIPQPNGLQESDPRHPSLNPAGFGTHTGMVNGRPERPRSSDETLRNREMIRKLLEEHESTTRPTAYSSNSDLQVMVDCISSELEKERTLRLRLEIELRKVENQLEQERKLNERLAALLMKR